MNRPDAARAPAALVAVALLVVLAGCATVSTETTTTTLARTETFEVRMTGNSTATYVVSAELVSGAFENVTVTYANGSSRVLAVPSREGGYTYGPASGVTSVEPGAAGGDSGAAGGDSGAAGGDSGAAGAGSRGGVVGGVYFEGSPEFSVTANEVPPTGTVVYSVRRKGEDVLAAWGLVRCGGHVSGLSLTANESGIEGLGFACEA